MIQFFPAFSVQFEERDFGSSHGRNPISDKNGSSLRAGETRKFTTFVMRRASFRRCK